MGEDNKNLEASQSLDIAVPGEWVVRKLLGPTFDVIGQDISKVYAKGRDAIFDAARRKTEDINDGKQANLRVTRDVLWNGAFSDSEVCAEYFGGIMASSRSEDGKDDSAIQFVDVTKSLSTKQLYLHYVIYNSLNKLLVASDTRVNIAMGSELEARQVWFATLELRLGLDLTVDTDLNILFRHGLLRTYKLDTHTVGSSSLPYISAKPTIFGVLLYASAHNRYKEWRQFDRLDFGDFEEIELPTYYCESLEALAERAGLTEPTNVRESTEVEEATTED